MTVPVPLPHHRVHPEIRPVAEAELPVLQDIECAAGAAFADLGMHAVAEDEPPTVAALREYAADGRAWVAVDGPRIAGYLVAAVLDGCAHVEQVSVHPDWRGHRVGRALLAHLDRWAHARGLPALTLTTFAEVPWNAPYYARRGFRVLTAAEIGPQLAAVREAERAHGLDRWPRVCMRRETLGP